MTRHPEDLSTLISAYVDGELSQEARAEVLTRAARDPAFARELAAVTRLKATLEAAVPVPDIALPRARPSRWWSRVALGIAAGLLLLVAAGGGWLLAGRNDGGRLDARLDWAIALHRAWTVPDGRAPEASVAIPGTVPITPHVPDLSANGLEFAHAAAAETPEGAPALVLGYLGSRGCRLTMVVVRVPDKAEERLSLTRGDVRASLWRAGGLDYLLLAEGMVAARFRLVAESVARATRSRAPFGPETRLALRQNRAGSPRCAA